VEVKTVMSTETEEDPFAGMAEAEEAERRAVEARRARAVAYAQRPEATVAELRDLLKRFAPYGDTDPDTEVWKAVASSQAFSLELLTGPMCRWAPCEVLHNPNFESWLWAGTCRFDEVIDSFALGSWLSDCPDFPVNLEQVLWGQMFGLMVENNSVIEHTFASKIVKHVGLSYELALGWASVVQEGSDWYNRGANLGEKHNVFLDRFPTEEMAFVLLGREDGDKKEMRADRVIRAFDPTETVEMPGTCVTDRVLAEAISRDANNLKLLHRVLLRRTLGPLTWAAIEKGATTVDAKAFLAKKPGLPVSMQKKYAASKRAEIRDALRQNANLDAGVAKALIGKP
jgi:hypothetical protein